MMYKLQLMLGDIDCILLHTCVYMCVCCVYVVCVFVWSVRVCVLCVCMCCVYVLCVCACVCVYVSHKRVTAPRTQPGGMRLCVYVWVWYGCCESVCPSTYVCVLCVYSTLWFVVYCVCVCVALLRHWLLHNDQQPPIEEIHSIYIYIYKRTNNWKYSALHSSNGNLVPIGLNRVCKNA